MNVLNPQIGRRNLLRVLTVGAAAATAAPLAAAAAPMGTGEVDYNWAKEHHDLWLADQIAKGRAGNHPDLPAATPAE